MTGLVWLVVNPRAGAGRAARGDFHELMSTVDARYLQLMTGRENRNFIEVIRQASADF